jgi:hypothetical protein
MTKVELLVQITRVPSKTRSGCNTSQIGDRSKPDLKLDTEVPDIVRHTIARSTITQSTTASDKKVLNSMRKTQIQLYKIVVDNNRNKFVERSQRFRAPRKKLKIRCSSLAVTIHGHRKHRQKRQLI